MSSDQPSSQVERIEQRALERDLVAQLSPNKGTQQKAKAKASRLRELLKRVKERKADEQ
jgi:hypothetical protein